MNRSQWLDSVKIEQCGKSIYGNGKYLYKIILKSRKPSEALVFFVIEINKTLC